jgi:hypothetical protein
LIRTRILRENGKYLPKEVRTRTCLIDHSTYVVRFVEAFVMRKHFFVNEENGYLTMQQTRQQPVKNPMTGSSIIDNVDDIE